VSKYRRFHPDDRPLVIELLVSRPSFARVLLAEVSQKNAGVTVEDIHASHARQIKSFADGTLSDQLAAVWGSLNESSADRLATIETWKTEMQPSVLEKGDLRSGRDLFGKTCAPCHKFHGEGQAVGPDLTGSQRSNLDYLLSNILDPSAVVSKDYRSSLVVTDDGRTLNGLVMRRDEQTLVLRTATDQISLPQSEVAEIKETGLSAMPDGLLQNFTKEQVRDLIAYLMAP
jgi:putative heme-binding domain-containing protein